MTDEDLNAEISQLRGELEVSRWPGMDLVAEVVRLWRDIRPRVAPASSEAGADFRRALDALAAAMPENARP